MLKNDSREIEQFIHGLVHEIRNPVQGILASADALHCRHEGDGTSEKLLGMIRGESARIDQVLSDLLDLVRPADRTKVSVLSRLAEESVREFQHSNSSVKVVAEYASGLRPLYVDDFCIRRAINAVLQNGVEANPIDATIRLSVEERGDYQTIAIQDKGEGIRPENLDRVVQPFFSTRPKKAGLGLAIAYRFVDLHAGQMKIESAKGTGTVVILRFPVER